MIRSAEFKDYEQIRLLLRHYADQLPLEEAHDVFMHTDKGMYNLFAQIQSQGIILVCTDSDDVAQGVLIAAIQPNLWAPYVFVLQELVWWVEPEYRNSRMGLALLKAYTDFGRKQKAEGNIAYFTLSTMSEGTALNMEKRGWRAFETTYIYEGET